ncbi:hypothetical protein CNMCM5793_004719 [Aspergillus hiratsukae]|uniref:Uncharacterized protein n=1 Tax=Aspergillus hiratsukae TaxID=1194566 RepID=A0A8H6UJ68_9EURO|nr:hypothetical protein CNMCM5793_004719 [Aspergillus hiratsukae]KAF7171452.1 hypothetical protein CNMCM6106_005854 [Aspergillus hiratsukae]
MSPVWLGTDYLLFSRNMPQWLCHRDDLEIHGRGYDRNCRNMLSGVSPSGIYPVHKSSQAHSKLSTWFSRDVDSNTYSIRSSATSTESWWASEVWAWGPQADTVTSYNYTSIGTEGRETSKTGTMRSPGSFNAYGVEVRWQSTDFTTPPATGAVTTTGVVTTTQAAPAETQSSTGSSSSLSTGAKVGIGLGVTAGVVLATALGLGLLWFRRRRRQQPNATQDQPGNSDYNELSGLPGTGHKPLTYETAELPANPARRELFEVDEQSSK